MQEKKDRKTKLKKDKRGGGMTSGVVANKPINKFALGTYNNRTKGNNPVTTRALPTSPHGSPHGPSVSLSSQGSSQGSPQGSPQGSSYGSPQGSSYGSPHRLPHTRSPISPYNNGTEQPSLDALYNEIINKFASSLIRTEDPVKVNISQLLDKYVTEGAISIMSDGNMQPPSDVNLISIDCGDEEYDDNDDSICCTISKKVCTKPKDTNLLRKILEIVSKVVQELFATYITQFAPSAALNLDALNIVKGVLYSYTYDFFMGEIKADRDDGEKFKAESPSFIQNIKDKLPPKVFAMTYVMALGANRQQYLIKATIGVINANTDFPNLNKIITGKIVEKMKELVDPTIQQYAGKRKQLNKSRVK